MRLFHGGTVRFAIAGAALVLVTGIVGAAPVIDAESHRAIADATLVTPALYVVLAPFCTVLDALTLLSLRQHAALALTLLLVLVTWRTVVHRRQGTRWSAELRVALVAFVAWLVVYAGGVLLPRPMAAIHLRDPDDLTIDFHSHTNFSWDGRRHFTAAANRAWHTAAGFDVAYVSDHKSFSGALRGMATNPPHGGGATILLPALEARDHYEHVIALGLDPRAPFDAKGEWHDPVGDTPHGTAGTAGATRPAPLLILTIPGNIHQLPDNELHGVARVVAIELSDGAPRGMNQIQRDERDILRFADTLHLAVIAGSDNHGWGHTAVAWSVMHIPGWRTLAPPQLDSAIQYTIRTQRRGAARVYLRDTPNPGVSPVALALTAPAALWRVLADLSWPERGSWIVWLFVVPFLAVGYNSIWGRGKTGRGA